MYVKINLKLPTPGAAIIWFTVRVVCKNYDDVMDSTEKSMKPFQSWKERENRRIQCIVNSSLPGIQGKGGTPGNFCIRMRIFMTLEWVGFTVKKQRHTELDG